MQPSTALAAVEPLIDLAGVRRVAAATLALALGVTTLLAPVAGAAASVVIPGSVNRPPSTLPASDAGHQRDEGAREQASSARPAAFEGTLELLVAERAGSRQSHGQEEYRLLTATGRVKLIFASEPPAGFVNGASVRVQGRRVGDIVVVEGKSAAEGSVTALDGSSGGHNQVLVAAPGLSTGVRRIAVVPMNFTNDRGRPFSPAFASGIVFTNTRSAKGYFEEQSNGAVKIEGAAFDWVELSVSNATCDPSGWASSAKRVLASRGVDVASFTNFVFIFPQTNNCPWRGLGHLPGPHSWVNGVPSLRTTLHELGHNFGAHHANSLTCTKDGRRVPLSANCTTSEYGDPFTPMGAAEHRHDHNLHLAQLGYVPVTATGTITRNGTYVLRKVKATTGVRIYRIPRGDGTFLYLEYRRPYGTLYDNFAATDPAVKGVMIRIAGDWNEITRTKLIDTGKRTTTFADAALRVGRSFRDYVSGVTVTVTDIGRSRIWLSVAFPADTTPPSAPGSVSAQATSTTAISLAWTASTDNRGVAGYRIWRNGQLIATTQATTRSFTDMGLQAETAYEYAVRAFDVSGNVSNPTVASTSTKPLDRPPSAPVASIEAINGRSARVTWTVAVDDHRVAAYRVLRNGELYTTVSGDHLEAKVPLDSARYSVIAVDSAGNASPPSNEVWL